MSTPSTPSTPSWHVRRRWLPTSDGRGVHARFASHRRRRAARRDDDRWYDWFDDGGCCLDVFDGWVALAIVAAGLLAVVLFVFGGPVLMLGVDLVWFVVVFVVGAVGRFVFGRPWRVEARRGDERRDWFVRGYGDAARLRDTLQAEFDAGLDPRPDARR